MYCCGFEGANIGTKHLSAEMATGQRYLRSFISLRGLEMHDKHSAKKIKAEVGGEA